MVAVKFLANVRADKHSLSHPLLPYFCYWVFGFGKAKWNRPPSKLLKCRVSVLLQSHAHGFNIWRKSIFWQACFAFWCYDWTVAVWGFCFSDSQLLGLLSVTANKIKLLQQLKQTRLCFLAVQRADDICKEHRFTSLSEGKCQNLHPAPVSPKGLVRPMSCVARVCGDSKGFNTYMTGSYSHSPYISANNREWCFSRIHDG